MPELTVADVVKKVKRLIPDLDEKGKQKIGKDKKPAFVEVAFKESDVLSFKDYGKHIVVVTRDGQKHSNAES
tara:strand:- start:280 stop:495 length:216 start_codon:yes stop_codon:yes gene_type:complete